jgi:hypothetical protein
MLNANDAVAKFIARHQGISWLILLVLIFLGSYE